MFEKCSCLFEQEGVFYDFKVIKIMKGTKNIFDLSYWTGLYNQNCRIYDPFYVVGDKNSYEAMQELFVPHLVSSLDDPYDVFVDWEFFSMSTD